MLVRILLFLITALPAAAVAAELAFRDGERLTYRVSWAIVPGAGEITVNAARSAGDGGAPRLVVTTTTTTRRLARMLLPFDAEETCVFDLTNGHLLSLRETSVQREKRTETAVTFDHERREATYSGPKSGGQPQLLRMPDKGHTQGGTAYPRREKVRGPHSRGPTPPDKGHQDKGER